MSSSYQILTADDEGCGIEITRTGVNGYKVSTIETHGSLGVYLSPEAALIRAGEALMDYRDSAISDYIDPETGETVPVDWSATYRQGQRLVDDCADYRVYLDDLDEDDA